jgi:laminin alpha 1/2
VKIKSAESPLPKAWILEKSIDGDIYEAWQYFAVDDDDCRSRYGLPGRNANYTAQTAEVTCTTQYSESTRLKYGEAKFVVALLRPQLDTGDNFTLARFIRMRLQGLVKDTSEIDRERIVKWSPDAEDLLKRAYYSIQSLNVIGRCYCSGHAAKCRELPEDGDKRPQCECMHNTCGKNCDKCCPLFNQRPFRVGTPQKENQCEKCQCHGHATECRYSEDVDKRNLSLDMRGKMSGGGVCVNCTKFTTGINCEKCQSGYYRPYDRAPDDEEPCVACDCDERGSNGICNPLGKIL